MESVKPDIDRLKHEISGRFREAREALKMTPPALAKAVGGAAQTIRDYEDGKSIPGGAVLAGMARLGVDVAYVLTGGGTVLIEAKQLSAREPDTAYGINREAIDSVLLQGVLDFFFAWLDENAHRARIDRSRHGAVIAVLYRVALQSGAVRKAELEQVLAIAA